MSKVRQVRVFKWERGPDGLHSERIFDTCGIFHRWGQDYEEFESGPGNFSTAIVELSDGKVKNVPVEMIEFVKENQDG